LPFVKPPASGSDADPFAIEVVMGQVDPGDACSAGFAPCLDSPPVADIGAAVGVELEMDGSALMFTPVPEKAEPA